MNVKEYLYSKGVCFIKWPKLLDVKDIYSYQAAAIAEMLLLAPPSLNIVYLYDNTAYKKSSPITMIMDTVMEYLQEREALKAKCDECLILNKGNKFFCFPTGTEMTLRGFSKDIVIIDNPSRDTALQFASVHAKGSLIMNVFGDQTDQLIETVSPSGFIEVKSISMEVYQENMKRLTFINNV